MIQNIGFNSISNVMIDCAQVKFIVLVKLNDCDGKIDLYQKNHCGIKASWWQDGRAYLSLSQCQSCFIKTVTSKVAQRGFTDESKPWTICSWVPLVFLVPLVPWVPLISWVPLVSWMPLPCPEPSKPLYHSVPHRCSHRRGGRLQNRFVPQFESEPIHQEFFVRRTDEIIFDAFGPAKTM